MIYLKSVVAGLLAVLSLIALLFVGIAVYLWASASRELGAGAIGWDPISIFGLAPVLIILAVFLAGFLWEFRRVSR